MNLLLEHSARLSAGPALVLALCSFPRQVVGACWPVVGGSNVQVHIGYSRLQIPYLTPRGQTEASVLYPLFSVLIKSLPSSWSERHVSQLQATSVAPLRGPAVVTLIDGMP